MQTKSYTIGAAKIDDLQVAADLFNQYREFYEQESDLQAAVTFLKERIQRNESVIFLAVDDAGSGLGFTQLYPMFSSVRMKPVWILNDLFVAPEARRRGVGRALMDRAADMARKSGAAGIELATAKDNTEAKSVYEDLGYELDTEFDHYSLSV